MGVEHEGTWRVSIASREPNILLLIRVSPEAVEIAQALRDDPRFKEHFMPSTWGILAYMTDGAPLIDLPLIKRIPRDGYKTLHWTPVMIKAVDA
jgi:hypothetical protein